MQTTLLNTYRQVRVLCKQAVRVEPFVPLQVSPALEFHGNNYCGWNIPRDSLSSRSVVVDVGLGEDISFSTSLMAKYRCTVHGFDPTPRAIQFVKGSAPPGFVLHEVGVASTRGPAEFYLPNEEAYVSGSLAKAGHLGAQKISVQLITIGDVFNRVGCERIDLLKLDIEGAEYELIAGDDFKRRASQIDALCIEFHHRWKIFGRKATTDAVATLNALGFQCAWRSGLTNEEFLFVRSTGKTEKC